MAIMNVKQYAEYVGISVRMMRNYIAQNRVAGLYRLGRRNIYIDTSEARILPPVNREVKYEGFGKSKRLKNQPD